MEAMWKGFFEFLEKFHFGQISSLLVLITCLFLLVCIALKPTVKIGKFCFSVGKNRKIPHLDCPFSSDFFHVVSKTTELVTRMCYLENVVKLDKQMSYVEEKFIIIKSILMNNFSELLLEKINTGVPVSDDYQIYERYIDSLLNDEIKKRVRVSFINNGFVDLSDTEFRVYVKDKCNYFFDLSVQTVDRWYISGKMVVPREEVKASVFRLKYSFTDFAFDIYSNAVRVIKETETEKDRMKKELENFCLKIIGKDKK
ncbi:MAG: hypothetical protein HQK96_14025 [Nitrospirae bacterium]|nr:hypothetical protein [Nitrospirota bacterium]